jgi:hypothetical protein
MRSQDCVKRNTERKTSGVMIRLTPSSKAWLASKGLSPARIFKAAMKELGYKGD